MVRMHRSPGKPVSYTHLDVYKRQVEDTDLSMNEDIDDSSLFEGIVQKHKNMIQVSYDVFKLISDDFLQSLPMNVIKCVIDTLVNFVTQKRNLNISCLLYTSRCV